MQTNPTGKQKQSRFLPTTVLLHHKYVQPFIFVNNKRWNLARERGQTEKGYTLSKRFCYFTSSGVIWQVTEIWQRQSDKETRMPDISPKEFLPLA